MKSLALSKYFEIIHPVYVYLKIIPHKSIRNCNSSDIAKSMSDTYKNIIKRVHREQKKVFIEAEYKISYIIDITKNNSSFYFLVPTLYKEIILEKIKEIWDKATVEEMEDIPKFTDNKITYQLGYKKDDSLSLKVDKRTNEPLNNILNVIDIIKDDDRVAIAYNFMPCSQFGWKEKYDTMLKKFEDKKPLEKKITFDYGLKIFLGIVVGTLDCFLSVIGDFLGNSDHENENLYKKIMVAFEEKAVLSNSTILKKNSNVIATQIAVISDSSNRIRKVNNALSVCQSYNVLREDNELLYKKTNRKFELKDYNYKIDTSLCSVDECKNFLQIPGYELIKQFKMKSINVEESKVPEELQKGYIELGLVTYRGTKVKSFIEDSYDKGSLPLVMVGAQGAGKSTFGANYYKFVSLREEGGVAIDFIKNCEMSDEIISYLPKEKVIILDLTKESDIQGFAFNELNITKEMDSFKRSELANLQSQQIVEFVDAVNPYQPLQSRMRRYLSSAATIVFSTGENSIKEVIRCLENHKGRIEYLNRLNEKDKEYLKEEVDDMEALHEYSKPTKENPTPEIVGTKESKIEGILDRISLLRSDFKLKYMFNKDGSNNVNFVDELEKGKVIIVKMKQDSFKKHAKNVITTFLLSKIWIATEIRGSLHKRPKPTHIFIDEVFQTETAMKMLANDDILPQTRKFGCKFIFSCQYTNQIDILLDTLIGAGSSFMFLTGTNEKDFDKFKNKLGDFEFDDLKNMEKYSSLNLIYYSGGYSSFISKLPKPIK
ncbi:hypothetical protein [Clostridium beijerinckii]|uniref:hypothetical protein n=1 Tax=Clostridium beijerinckii TaxID=1520 RepID=UPI00098CB9F1|nr:hypothetical protein [Clostridium beijerinckii]NRT76262.1 hypothetical protein [Clostridium beijerinckii]OOM37166.1 AAA-like domain protein [Clostridium beijerinckii]